MDSLQLKRILSRNPHTKKFFKGVYSSNTPPYPNKRANICWTLNLPCRSHYYPFSFIANTSRAGEIGEHWCAFFVLSPQECDFYDPLAEEPNEDFKLYLSQFKKINQALKATQSHFSDSCGHFCIYFLIHRSIGWSFDKIVQSLLSDPLRDQHVKLFTRLLLGI